MFHYFKPHIEDGRVMTPFLIVACENGYIKIGQEGATKEVFARFAMMVGTRDLCPKCYRMNLRDIRGEL